MLGLIGVYNMLVDEGATGVGKCVIAELVELL